MNIARRQIKEKTKEIENMKKYDAEKQKIIFKREEVRKISIDNQRKFNLNKLFKIRYILN